MRRFVGLAWVGVTAGLLWSAAVRADRFYTLSSLPDPIYGPATPITLGSPSHTVTQGGYSSAAVIDGIIAGGNGWAIGGANSTERVVFQNVTPIPGGNLGSRLTFTLHYPRNDRHTIGHFRLAVTSDPSPSTASPSSIWTTLTPISVTATSGESWLIPPASDAFAGALGGNRVLWDPTQGAPGTTGPAEVLTVVADTTLSGITGIQFEALYFPNIFTGSGDLGGPGLSSANGNFVFSELELSAQSIILLLAPEPGSWALMGLALAAFGGFQYYRRRR